ncbi:MAG: bifunctional UDP-N-acetylmuramoyl-tripeptide:D-alanyl-D-alanine ligase/alanine racemase [Bacteroidetes bacterium]|nr:MAG: bifunctional UDP-N-acetylmuramoyl-tripeptide:D-alanyl-D-alanine ligase/alanine racemase [Bacteroidota bacterium]
MNWSLEHIGQVLGGRSFGDTTRLVKRIAVDSRSIVAEEGSLFVALKGPNHDGHRFIPELYDRGVRAFLVSDLPDTGAFPEAGFCLVEDGLFGLQRLASAWRELYTGRVTAITGSNGKTIVKEWIYQCMHPRFRVHRSPQSYNSQLGVPLSVCMAGSHHEFAIYEAGISQPGEMERLAAIIRPEIGVFTNLGTAHGENFRSDEQKLREKLKLFSTCERLIYRADQELEGRPLSDFMEAFPGMLVGWSTGQSGTYRYRINSRSAKGIEGELHCPTGCFPFHLPDWDSASLENGLHALTFAIEAGMKPGEALERARQLEPVSMRLEILEGIRNSLLINDSYNADVAGLDAALDLMQRQDPQRKKTVILSDLIQSGDPSRVYRSVARLLRQYAVEQFIGIGKVLLTQQDCFDEGSLFFHDVREFLNRADPELFRNRLILVKGSRRFRFEKISRELQEKSHQTRLEVNLSIMAHNLGVFRRKLAEGVEVMAMVKALSYGSGVEEVAHMLAYHKVDALAVAFADEGIALRHAGIHLPIMVMNAGSDDYEGMIDFGLEPELYSLNGLRAFVQLCRYRDLSGYPVHLKLDTGMHRLGLQAEDLEAALPLLKAPGLELRSVFSHLVASDSPQHDDFSRRQIAEFSSLCSQIADHCGPFKRHILNTAGIERFPEAHFEMVRLGIGLHGVGLDRHLQAASSFKTRISQIRQVRKGASIGYGRAQFAEKDSLVATLPVGYADGMDRRLGRGRGRVWIAGKLLPTIGDICMDMTMIDVSGLSLQEGDEVEIFGSHQHIAELARVCETIPYEILTGLSGRVKRVYLQE